MFQFRNFEMHKTSVIKYDKINAFVDFFRIIIKIKGTWILYI